jgi:hypothetical protein
MATRSAKSPASRSSGNLRIGDHWNAITIIALSQSNPLKAVAELVENSIDAGAKTIVITRGKDKGQHYLRVKDDGAGVRRTPRASRTFLCGHARLRLHQAAIEGTGAGGLQGEVRHRPAEFLDAGETCC